jgi:hypothetical protein
MERRARHTALSFFQYKNTRPALSGRFFNVFSAPRFKKNILSDTISQAARRALRNGLWE